MNISQSYHKPPELNWNPAVLSSWQVEAGLESTVEDGRVRVTVKVGPRPPRKYPPSDDVEEIEFRRKLNEILDSDWHEGDFKIDIAFDPDRFIRNVWIEHDINMPSKTIPEEISESLRVHGFIRVTPEFEHSIARRFCSDLDAIEELENEFALQQKTKMKNVEDRDFESAARLRDNQSEVLRRLDDLVKKSALDA